MDAMMHDMPMPGNGSHEGHDGMDMQCSMSMVWNTATSGMCIVFGSWRVSGPLSLTASIIALALLGMLLEFLRFRIRTLDARLLSSSGLLESLYGNATHRRKASVQRVHSLSKSGSGSFGVARANDYGVISGSSSSLGRHAAFGPDNASTSSRSDDDAPLLPANTAAMNRRKRKGLFSRRHEHGSLFPALAISRVQQLQRTSLYVSSVSLSMFLMLVFMTYNAWLIAAVLAGAGAGHYLFHRDLGLGRLDEEKGAACH